MPHFEFYELSPEAKRDAARLRGQIAGNAMLLALYRLEGLLRKANFKPDQPRVPAGSSEGGQWAGEGSGDGSSTVHHPRLLSIGYRPGKEPPKPPRIPVDKPASGTVRNTIIKATVKFLVGAARVGARVDPPVWAAIEAASWAKPYIASYFDKPKTLEALQRAASEPETGYDIHHVVERSSAKHAGFPESLIESPENRVKIPTLKHWQINSWFEAPTDIFGGLTPRGYLRNPKIGWEERVKIGKDALVKAGVLKQ
jgi:hypothetical protein